MDAIKRCFPTKCEPAFAMRILLPCIFLPFAGDTEADYREFNARVRCVKLLSKRILGNSYFDFQAELEIAEIAALSSAKYLRLLSVRCREGKPDSVQTMHGVDSFHVYEDHKAWMLSHQCEKLMETASKFELRTCDIPFSGQIRLKAIHYFGATSKLKMTNVEEDDDASGGHHNKYSDGVYCSIEICEIHEEAEMGEYVRRAEGASEKVCTRVGKKARLMKWSGAWALTAKSISAAVVITIIRKKPLKPDIVIGCGTLRIAEMRNFRDTHRDIQLVSPGPFAKPRRGRILRVSGSMVYIGSPINLSDSLPNSISVFGDFHAAYALIAAAIHHSASLKRGSVERKLLDAIERRYALCESYTSTIRLALTVSSISLSRSSLASLIHSVEEVVPGEDAFTLDMCSSLSEESLRLACLNYVRESVCVVLGELPDASSRCDWTDTLFALAHLLAISASTVISQFRASTKKWFRRALHRTLYLDQSLRRLSAIAEMVGAEMSGEVQVAGRYGVTGLIEAVVAQLCECLCKECQDTAFECIQLGTGLSQKEDIGRLVTQMDAVLGAVSDVSNEYGVGSVGEGCGKDLQNVLCELVQRWLLFVDEDADRVFEEKMFQDQIETYALSAPSLFASGHSAAVFELMQSLLSTADLFAGLSSSLSLSLTAKLHATVSRLCEQYASRTREECQADIYSFSVGGGGGMSVGFSDSAKSTGTESSILTLTPPSVCLSHLSANPTRAHISDSLTFTEWFKHGAVALPPAALTPSQSFSLCSLDSLLSLLQNNQHSSILTRNTLSLTIKLILLSSASLFRVFAFGVSVSIIWFGTHVAALTSPLSLLLSQLSSLSLPPNISRRFAKYIWRAVADGLVLGATVETMGRRGGGEVQDTANTLLVKLVKSFCASAVACTQMETPEYVSTALPQIRILFEMSEWGTREVTEYFAGAARRTLPKHFRRAILQILALRRRDKVAQAFVRMNRHEGISLSDSLPGTEIYRAVAKVFCVEEATPGTLSILGTSITFMRDGDSSGKDFLTEYGLAEIKNIFISETTAAAPALSLLSSLQSSLTLTVSDFEIKNFPPSLRAAQIFIECGAGEGEGRGVSPPMFPIAGRCRCPDSNIILEIRGEGDGGSRDVTVSVWGLENDGRQIFVGKNIFKIFPSRPDPPMVLTLAGGGDKNSTVVLRASLHPSPPSSIPTLLTTFEFQSFQNFNAFVGDLCRSPHLPPLPSPFPLRSPLLLFQAEFLLPSFPKIIKEWRCSHNNEIGTLSLLRNFICFKSLSPPRRRIRLSVADLTNIIPGGILDSQIDLVTENEIIRFSDLLNSRDEIVKLVRKQMPS